MQLIKIATRTLLLPIVFGFCAFAQSAPPSVNATRLTTTPVARNAWRGLTPLRSSVVEIAQMFGEPQNSPESSLVGPYKIEDGEVTFTYLTPSLAKLYRAPAAMTHKLFTIYFKPSSPLYRADVQMDRSFRRCAEVGIKGRYYMVSDAGIAYQISESSERVETIIYQPSRLEVRRLAVNTECVF